MEMKVGYEEEWIIVPEGSHRGGCWIELPDEVVARIRDAEKEWSECVDIMSKAARAQGY